MSTRKKTSFDFEKALASLEKLVTRMESGNLSLEESMAAFEEGIALTRQCQQALHQAEQKVQLLMEKNGQVVTDVFSEEDDET